MRLIQLSDCHLFADCEKTGYRGINPYHSLQQVLQHVMHDKPDAVIVTGDISGDDSKASYELFIELMQRELSTVSWRIIAGNHDVNPHFSVLEPYLLSPRVPWLLDNYCIHGLDSRHQGGNGIVGRQQLDGVSEAIDKHCKMHHLLFLHHHIIAANSWMDKHSLVNANEVESWLTQHHAIKQVFHGHVHYPLERAVGDCAIYGVPSTCWQFAMSKTFDIDDSPPGYRIIDLAESGDITTEIRRVE